jgi:hypothetical protein
MPELIRRQGRSFGLEPPVDPVGDGVSGHQMYVRGLPVRRRVEQGDDRCVRIRPGVVSGAHVAHYTRMGAPGRGWSCPARAGSAGATYMKREVKAPFARMHLFLDFPRGTPILFGTRVAVAGGLGLSQRINGCGSVVIFGCVGVHRAAQTTGPCGSCRSVTAAVRACQCERVAPLRPPGH